MAKVRVYQLAKELKSSGKELLNYLEQIEIAGKNHMSVFNDNEVE